MVSSGAKRFSAERGEPGNKLDLSEVAKLHLTPFDNAKSSAFCLVCRHYPRLHRYAVRTARSNNFSAG